MDTAPRFSLSLLTAVSLLFATAFTCAAAEKLSELRGVFRSSFNHDASRVVVLSREGAVTIWELPAGAPVAGDVDPKVESDGFLMSADGKMVMIGFKDGRCRVFDPTTARSVSPFLDFRLNAEFRTPGLFSPDGNTLLIFGDKEAVAYEIRSGKRLATISLGEGISDEATGSAAFATGGSQCFLMDGSGTVTRYDTKEWKAAGAPMSHPKAEAAYELGFSLSDDGKWLATYDDPGENGPKSNLQVWDATTNKAIGKPLTAVNGMTGRFIGNRILALPGRGEATVRDLPSMKVAYKLRMHDDIEGPNAEVSPDRKWILVWGADRGIDLVDGATGKLATTYSGSARISKLIVAPDSSCCYVLFDNTAFFLQGHHDQYVVKLTLPELKVTESVRVLDFVLGVNLSPDGKRLLVQQGMTDKERLVFFDAASLKAIE